MPSIVATSFKRPRKRVLVLVAPIVRVFIAQLVEHFSANAEGIGLNPVEVPKFFRVNLQFLKLQLPLRRSYLHVKKFFLFPCTSIKRPSRAFYFTRCLASCLKM